MGAAAVATLAPDTLAAVTVDDGGSGYTTAPAVTFSGGDGGSGAAATAGLTLYGKQLLIEIADEE